MNAVSTVEFPFGDKTYSLSSLTIGDMAAFRNFIRNRRLSAVREAFQGTPELTAQLKEALATKLTDGEVSEAIKELESVIYLLHRSISKKHPEMTPDKCGDLVAVADLKDLGLLLTAMMGGSAGPQVPPAATPEATTQTGTSR